MLCFHHKKCAKLHKQSQFTSKFIAEFIPTSVRNISDGSRYNTGLLIGREKKVKLHEIFRDVMTSAQFFAT